MKYFKYIIPNAFTALNLLSGATAIILLLDGGITNYYIPAFLLAFAALCDLLDGLLAKLLNATSEFGKQLDSLSDLISFGLAPAILLFKLLEMSIANRYGTDISLQSLSINEQMLLFSSLLLAVFAALRLARYNISTSDSTDFTGLPVPASALIVVALWVAVHTPNNDQQQIAILNPYFLLGILISLSFLMVSNITMLSLKFTGFNLRQNLWRYILLIGSLIIILSMQFSALLYIMLFYITLSMLKNLVNTLQEIKS